MNESEFERLIRIEIKLDELIRARTEQGQEFKEALLDHETRLRGLEQFKWRSVGAAAAISIAVGGAAGAFAGALGIG